MKTFLFLLCVGAIIWWLVSRNRRRIVPYETTSPETTNGSGSETSSPPVAETVSAPKIELVVRDLTGEDRKRLRELLAGVEAESWRADEQLREAMSLIRAARAGEEGFSAVEKDFRSCERAIERTMGKVPLIYLTENYVNRPEVRKAIHEASQERTDLRKGIVRRLRAYLREVDPIGDWS
jgi:hypothetical protein